MAITSIFRPHFNPSTQKLQVMDVSGDPHIGGTAITAASCTYCTADEKDTPLYLYVTLDGWSECSCDNDDTYPSFAGITSGVAASINGNTWKLTQGSTDGVDFYTVKSSGCGYYGKYSGSYGTLYIYYNSPTATCDVAYLYDTIPLTEIQLAVYYSSAYHTDPLIEIRLYGTGVVLGTQYVTVVSHGYGGSTGQGLQYAPGADGDCFTVQEYIPDVSDGSPGDILDQTKQLECKFVYDPGPPVIVHRQAVIPGTIEITT